jgi:hypothetical protein
MTTEELCPGAAVLKASEIALSTTEAPAVILLSGGEAGRADAHTRKVVRLSPCPEVLPPALRVVVLQPHLARIVPRGVVMCGTGVRESAAGCLKFSTIPHSMPGLIPARFACRSEGSWGDTLDDATCCGCCARLTAPVQCTRKSSAGSERKKPAAREGTRSSGGLPFSKGFGVALRSSPWILENCRKSILFQILGHPLSWLDVAVELLPKAMARSDFA